MTIRERILTALRSSDRLCDDCLSEATGIRPRQAVNAECRWMSCNRLLTRVKEDCARCQRVKLINALTEGGAAIRAGAAARPLSSASPAIRDGVNSRFQREAVDTALRSGVTCYLVSCVGQKRNAPSKAKDLYTSDWFRKARAHVERQSSPWFILSAEHGLVDPESVIAPYEKTLNEMSVQLRRQWANKVVEQMERLLPRCDEVVVLAGARYREFLMNHLSSRAPRVVVPLEGLRIGEQLSWLASRA